MAKMGLDKARQRMWKMWQDHSLTHSAEVVGHARGVPAAHLHRRTRRGTFSTAGGPGRAGGAGPGRQATGGPTAVSASVYLTSALQHLFGPDAAQADRRPPRMPGAPATRGAATAATSSATHAAAAGTGATGVGGGVSPLVLLGPREEDMAVQEMSNFVNNLQPFIVDRLLHGAWPQLERVRGGQSSVLLPSATFCCILLRLVSS